MNQTPLTIEHGRLLHLLEGMQIPQSIDQLAIAAQRDPAAVRQMLHDICNARKAHLVRPNGDFGYLPGPPPVKANQQEPNA